MRHVFKVAMAWDIIIEGSRASSFIDRALDYGLNAPCGSTGSDFVDAVAAVLLAPQVAPRSRYPLERCAAIEPDADALGARGIAQFRPGPDERLVLVEFVVRIEGAEEALARQLAYERYGVPLGEDADQLASAVDNEIDAIPNPASDGLEFQIPDYYF